MSDDIISELGINASGNDTVELDSLTLEALKKGPIDIFDNVYLGETRPHSLILCIDVRGFSDFMCNNDETVVFGLIKSFTEKRKEKLSELLEKYTQEEILETMFKIKDINFLLGRTDKSNWKISFDDFLNEEKFIKILEGAYYDEVKSTGRKQDKKIAKPKSAGTKKEYGF